MLREEVCSLSQFIYDVTLSDIVYQVHVPAVLETSEGPEHMKHCKC